VVHINTLAGALIRHADVMKWKAVQPFYLSVLVDCHHNLALTFATKDGVAAGVPFVLNLLQDNRGNYEKDFYFCFTRRAI
jgi:hypothetical protein